MNPHTPARPIGYHAALAYVAGLLVLWLLAGCAQQPSLQQQDVAQSVHPDMDSVFETRQTTNLATASKAPLEGEVFFSVLAAEMALAADNLELALGLYLKLLDKYQDIGVAERVVYLAESIGDYPDMANAAELWVAKQPDNYRAQVALANSLYQLGHFELLDAPLLSLLTLRPDFPFETLFEPVQPANSDPEALEALLKRLIAAEPNHPAFHLVLGQWLMEFDRHDEAKKALLASIRLKNTVAAQSALTRNEMRLTGPEAAAKTALKALKDFPNNRRLVVLYARYTSMANEAAQALPVLEDYYRTQPDDHPIIALYARIALEEGQYALARRLYENLLTFPHAANEASFFLGSIALEGGRYESALSYFRQVTPSDYYGPALSATIAIISDEQDSEAALQELETARIQYPEEALIYQELARLYVNRGDPVAALSTLDDGLQQNPGNNSLRYARAITLDSLQRKTEAIAALETLLNDAPDHVMALNALGYLLADTNQQLEKALSLIEKAYAINPKDAAIVDSLGWVHYRLGNLSLALDYLSQAFEQTHNHEIAAHLGEVLWVSGQRDDAEAVWLKGLQQTPGSQIILDTRARLLEQSADAL